MIFIDPYRYPLQYPRPPPAAFQPQVFSIPCIPLLYNCPQVSQGNYAFPFNPHAQTENFPRQPNP